MVVTDDDLFPPGTVSLNGLKLYGEEIGKVVSYALEARLKEKFLTGFVVTDAGRKLWLCRKV